MFRTPDENRTDGEREPGSGNRETGAIPGTRYPKPGSPAFTDGGREPVSGNREWKRGPRTPSPQSPAFTLLEMVVVVAIIALLLAIAVPVSTGLVRSSQEKATLATLETVKTAIEVFQNEKPLRFHPYQFESGGGGAWTLFGPLPPSPTARLTYKDTSPSPNLFQSAPETNPEPDKTARVTDERTQDKFTGSGGIIDGYFQAIYSPTGETDQAHRYPTSECLLLFLRTQSPQARAIIDRLGKYLTNEDKDTILRLDPNGKLYNPPQAEPLLELRDAWGYPVRYTVTRIGYVVGGILFRWELRSPGPDGKFSDVDVSVPPDGIPDPFSPQAEANPGDDVIVSGSIKVEN